MATKIKTYDENLRLTGVADMPTIPQGPSIKNYTFSTTEPLTERQANAIAHEIVGGTLVYGEVETVGKAGTHTIYSGIVSLWRSPSSYIELYLIASQNITLYQWG